MERSFSHNVRRLEQQLIEVSSERDAFEKDITTYAQENKALKEQIARLRLSRNEADSKAVQTLKEIQDLHKKKAQLREEEFKSSIKEKEKSIKELQESLKALKHEIEQCKLLDKENQLSSSKSSNQIARLKDKINILENENASKKIEVTKTQTEYDKKLSQQHVRISVLENQLRTARSEKETLNDELAQLKLKTSSDRAKKESDIHSLDEVSKSLRKQIKTLQNELRTKDENYNQAMSELNLQKKKQQSSQSKADAQIRKLEDETSQMQDHIKSKETQIKLISEQLKQSESSNRSLKLKHQKEVMSLEDELAAANNKLHEKESEVSSLRNKLTASEKKDEKSFLKHSVHLEKLQSEVEQITEEKNIKDRKLQKVMEELNLQKKKQLSLQSKTDVEILKLDDRISNLQDEVKSKETQIKLVTRQLHNEQSKANSSSSELQAIQTKLQNQLNQVEEESLEKTRTISQISEQLKQSESSNRSLKLKHQKEVMSLEDELAAANNKLHEKESEVSSVSTKYHSQVRNQGEKIEKVEKDRRQKEELIISLEAQLSDKESEIHNLKNQVRKLEIDKQRQERDLSQLQNMEAEQMSKSEATFNQIRSLRSEKRKLEAEMAELKFNAESETEKFADLQRELLQFKSAAQQKESKLTEVSGKVSRCKEEIALKLAKEQNLQCKVNSLTSANHQLKAETERLNELKQDLVRSIDDLSGKLKSLESENSRLKEANSSQSSRVNEVNSKQRSEIKQQKKEIEKLLSSIEHLSEQIDNIKSEKMNLEERCHSLEMESSLKSEIDSQLKTYKGKIETLQRTNFDLHRERDELVKEKQETSRKQVDNKAEKTALVTKVQEQEKTIGLLKESCELLEGQVDDLESFNNNLIEKENNLTAERDDALSKCSELRIQLSTAKHELKTELNTLDQCSNDQITDLKVELRNEMNNLHEVTEQYRDLQQKYKNLEINATALQRKLNSEKDARDRCAHDVERVRAEMDILQQSLRRAETNLRSEMDRCDVLERERTQMLNRIDTEKLEFSHELTRLNCQGAQQAKLIDFLQSRIEELEPAEKKKKKKKTTLYQVPLQYRELRDLLEEEKAANVKLQEQVNGLRSELQCTNSKVKRLKHGIDVPLSPGSIAAISAIVRSPAVATSTDEAPSPKGGKLRSKPRMHHNIPHRLATWVCHRATRCSVCMATIHFGHSALRCSECTIVCHTKCRSSIVNTCGLPGGLFQQFKEGAKSSNLSPISSVFKGGSNSDQLHGRLKVLCGDDTWVVRSVRISSDQVRIAPPSAKSPSRVSDKDDVIDLKQAAHVHTDLCQSELPSTTKQDLSYAFKIQTGSSNSCWPARSVYFLAAGFAEKHLWVEKLEQIAARHSQTKNITGNSKILGNEILTMLGDDGLELNCSLPISDKTILFGCDDGLYRLSPSTNTVSSRRDLKKVEGFTSVFQLTAISKSTVVAIEGQKHRLVSFSTSLMESSNSAVVHSIEDMEGCHLFCTGQAEGVDYLCVASAKTITVLRYNEKLKKFSIKKEIATTEPCTCMIFTPCSVILGTDTFYELDLTEFKVDEFIDEVAWKQYGDESVFPVSVVTIRQRDGRQEFLLCFHEFGLFVDGFGRQTRNGRIMWSRMPLSFEYREPYLIIIQFNSVEILLLDAEGSSAAESSKLDRAYLPMSRVRYLGSAITQGAVYLSSNDGGKTSIFCCKGNMKRPVAAKTTTAPKRHLAALSTTPAIKRTVLLSDVSSVSTLKSTNRSRSEQSIDSDTSRWTLGETDSMSGVASLRSENGSASSSNEESAFSESGSSTHDHLKLQWRPARTPPPKPDRRARPQKSKFDPVSSTQV